MSVDTGMRDWKLAKAWLLRLRAIDSVSARPLAGIGGALSPFWSPDGRSVAFYADGFLKRLDLDGGLVRTLAKATVGLGGTWSRDGVIRPFQVADGVFGQAGMFNRTPSAQRGAIRKAVPSAEEGLLYHHEDGRLALWVPVGEGLQPFLIDDAPAAYFQTAVRRIERVGGYHTG